MNNFNSVPQRRNKSAPKPATHIPRRVSAKTLAANRRRMAALVERVLRGEIQPRVISRQQKL